MEYLILKKITICYLKRLQKIDFLERLKYDLYKIIIFKLTLLDDIDYSLVNIDYSLVNKQKFIDNIIQRNNYYKTLDNIQTKHIIIIDAILKECKFIKIQLKNVEDTVFYIDHPISFPKIIKFIFLLFIILYYILYIFYIFYNYK